MPLRQLILVTVFALVPLANQVNAEGVVTKVKPEDLDVTGFTEWVDGVETPVSGDGKNKGRLPAAILWTTQSTPLHSGIHFGQTKTPGARHLRIAFKRDVPVGSILVRGGVKVSVLQPGAAAPGRFAAEEDWLPAERIAEGKISAQEGVRDSYLLWTLPKAVNTRAIRFTHVAAATDENYAGWIGAAYLLPSRLTNVAAQATPAVSTNERNGYRLNNESTDAGWDQWANLPVRGDGDRPVVVSDEKPEWAVLTWPKGVTLRGLGVAFAGFADADVQTFIGADTQHPREAPDSAWKTIGNFKNLKCGYPRQLPVDWLDFGSDVTTRALRVRMTRAMSGEMHPHVVGHGRDGKRVWAGELIAISPVEAGAGLASAILPSEPARENPPIPVRFNLPEAGWVTLVIEDQNGKRIRNLVSETWFDKGEQVAWWDGSDDLGRDPSAAKHGLYYIPIQFVQPGEYRVRGLWRKSVDVKYEFGVYTDGATPWETADRTGGWLSNHTPPSSVLYVPDAPAPGGTTRPTMLIGSYVSEGTAGLAWVDLDGNKWRGQNWVGGMWTGAPHLARDAGAARIAEHYAYVAAAWSSGDEKAKPPKGEIRLTALTSGQDKPVVKHVFTPTLGADGRPHWEDQIGGVAVHDGIAVVSLPATNRLIVIDVAAGKVTGDIELPSPRGVAFDAKGQLHVLSSDRLVRTAVNANRTGIATPQEVAGKLAEPHGLTIDAAGHLYIAERGNSHQVRVFDASGKPVRSVGVAGAPAAGPYNPLHLNNPRGIAVDPQGRLWLAEEDYQPKRVSLWSADGKLVRGFYGPAEYGGGGSIDPVDKNRFYYYGMEFRLDWQNGKHELTKVYYRPQKGDIEMPFRSGLPQTPIYLNGRRYWTNAYNSNPTAGHGSAFIFVDRNGIAVPAAGCGRAADWAVLKTPPFASVWPQGTSATAAAHDDKTALFLWSDANGDGQPQPDEVRLTRGRSGGVTVMDDLAFIVTRLNDQTVRLATRQVLPTGVPVYDLTQPQTLIANPNSPPSSGGDQAIAAQDGWVVHTNAPKPFSGSGVGGSRDGVAIWSYPSLWPGLHASHEGPVPDRPGMIVGHTRLLGGLIGGGADKTLPLFLLNANNGAVHVMSTDGLYVAQIFKDMRIGGDWRMPSAPRGMIVNDLTPGDENFWPFVTQTSEGSVYIVAGRPNCVVKVEGLESIRRLPDTSLPVTTDDLNRARDYFVRAEALRQQSQGRSTLAVQVRKAAPTVDGNVTDWAAADWADVDRRGTRAYFNSSSVPYNVTAAVAVSGDRLYAAWRTNDKDLLRNAGDVQNAPFKTGGALDLMIGASTPGAGDHRTAPTAGDVRLLITRVGGKTRALVYRQVVAAGETKQQVPFSSPGRTIPFDRVDDVSDQVQIAADASGNYEISVPLAAIGLTATPGSTIRGDIGILRGTGTTTTQRVYWSNKATAIVADVPSEAELKPSLWGRWTFTAE